jgi:predicted ATPase
MATALKIVLTGAPGSGKTTIATALALEQPNRFVHVPEAATQTYERLMTRWDKLDREGQRQAQLAIYRLQVEQEAQAELDAGQRILLLDRGTIDGAAYWPEGADDYWRTLNSSLESELARYDMVLLLESAAALGAYDGDASNRVRFESAQESLENAKVLAKLWGKHPKLVHIRATERLHDKTQAISHAISQAIESFAGR